MIIEKESRFTTIFIEDLAALKVWKETLAPYCILSTFHEDYTAIEKLGEGSFGRVYLVESKLSTQKRLAVKAFAKSDLLSLSDSYDTITNEIRLMWKLSDSPHFPTYHATYETENTIYMVM